MKKNFWLRVLYYSVTARALCATLGPTSSTPPSFLVICEVHRHPFISPDLGLFIHDSQLKLDEIGTKPRRHGGGCVVAREIADKWTVQHSGMVLNFN